MVYWAILLVASLAHGLTLPMAPLVQIQWVPVPWKKKRKIVHCISWPIGGDATNPYHSWHHSTCGDVQASPGTWKATTNPPTPQSAASG